MGANDEKAGHGPEEKGVRSGDHQGQIGKEGRGRPTRSLWKWKFYVIVFSKGPTTIEISQKLPKESDIFYEKGERSGKSSRTNWRRGDTQTRSLWTKFYVLFSSGVKKEKIFILLERGKIRKIIKRTNWQGGETQTRSRASFIPFLHIFTTLCTDDIVSFFTNSTTWSEMS